MESKNPMKDDAYEKILKSYLELNQSLSNNDLILLLIEDKLAREIISKKEISNKQYLKTQNLTHEIPLEKYSDAIFDYANSNLTNQIQAQLDRINLAENDPSFKIGRIESIEKKIENIYNNNKSNIEMISEDISYLRLIAHKSRRILGDGNCYYRTIMFIFLENAIFDNNINLFKKIIIDIAEKFNECYENNKRLSEDIKRGLRILNKKLVITLLQLIISATESKKENKLLIAYIILIKAFNYCPSFDAAIIMYFRYLIYEYILNNKRNFYSKKFDVKIGNLLPGKYQNDDEFQFDAFFNEDLLSHYSYAEKIIIYLTPFVLGINLNLLFYVHGSNGCIYYEKYKCHLENAPNLNIMYYDLHFDIVYIKSYYEKNWDFFDAFESKEKNQIVSEQKILTYDKKNKVSELNLKISKIFHRKKETKCFMCSCYTELQFSCGCYLCDLCYDNWICIIKSNVEESPKYEKCINFFKS